MSSKSLTSEIDIIQLVFSKLETNGYDIQCSAPLTPQFNLEISNLIKTYITSDIKSNLMVFLFQVYAKSVYKKNVNIDLSSECNILIISKCVFMEFFSMNNFHLEMFVKMLTDKRNSIFYSEIELFLTHYLNYLLLYYHDKYLIQIMQFITLSRQSKKHSIFCPLLKTNESNHDLFKNVFFKSIPNLTDWISVRSENEHCKRCITSLDSQLCMDVIYTTISLLEFDTNNNILNDVCNEKFKTTWNFPDLAPAMDFISSIYNTVSGVSNGINYQEETEFINDLFTDNNQMILLLLGKCLSLNMHHHLLEDTNTVNPIDSYHLALSSIIINTVLTVVINENGNYQLPDFKFDLNASEIKKISRKFLKVATQKLKKDYEIVLMDETEHFDFLIWCLKSKVCVKEIFAWFVDSRIFESTIEDRFLCHLSDLFAHFIDPLSAVKLSARICAINELNLPSHRYIKLLKLIILKMTDEMKIQTLHGLEDLQKNKVFYPNVNFEASLRKSCNQLSGNVENFEEIQLDLEFLLIANPERVIVELLKSAFFKTGTKEFVLKIIGRFKYILCTIINSTDFVIVRVLDAIFFHNNNQSAYSNDISERIESILIQICQLINTNSIADAILSNLVVPRLNTESVNDTPAFILLFVFIQHPHLHNDEFRYKLTSLLVAIGHLHFNLYQNGYGSTSSLTYIESSIKVLIKDFHYHINPKFVINHIDSLPFSVTKLLFWNLYKTQKQFISIPLSKYSFLSKQILEKFFFKMELSNDSTQNQDQDIVNDFEHIITLSCVSRRFLEISLESLESLSKDQINSWKLLSRLHIVSILTEMVSYATVDRWINVIKFLQEVVRKDLVIWFYPALSSLVPLSGNIESSGSLLIFSIIGNLLDIGSQVTDNMWFSKLIKLVVSSLSQFIPKESSESQSLSQIYVKFEILLHLLKMCHCFESKGDYGLQSVLLFAQPLLLKLADDAPSMPREMQQLLCKLSGFEKYQM